MNMDHLDNKPYLNEVTLTEQNPPLKCCWPLELLTQFFFKAENLGSVDQRALKVTGHETLRIIQPGANSILGGLFFFYLLKVSQYTVNCNLFILV